MIEINKKYADALKEVIDSDTEILGKTKIIFVNHRKKPESRSEIIRKDPDTDFIHLETTKNGKFFTEYEVDRVEEMIFENIL